MVGLWHMWLKSIQAHATQEEPAVCLWLKHVHAKASVCALGSCGGVCVKDDRKRSAERPFKLIFGSGAELLISDDALQLGLWEGLVSAKRTFYFINQLYLPKRSPTCQFPQFPAEA